jgi:hypothetical protein
MKVDIQQLNQFLSGAILLGHLAIGLFFLTYWRRTRDGLFARFAAAFWVLGFERVVLFLTRPEDEVRPFVYLIRLAAFLLLVYAIVEKNRPARKPQ